MPTEHDDTVAGARTAAEQGTLESWVGGSLRQPGSDNADLADQLAERSLVWHGPLRLPFDRLHRLAGPEDEPTMGRMDDDDLDRAEDMEASIDDGWEPAPLIVTYDDDHDHLVVEDGNHRIEGLRQAGHDDYWAVVGFGDAATRDRVIDGLPIVDASS